MLNLKLPHAISYMMQVVEALESTHHEVEGRVPKGVLLDYYKQALPRLQNPLLPKFWFPDFTKDDLEVPGQEEWGYPLVPYPECYIETDYEGQRMGALLHERTYPGNNQARALWMLPIVEVSPPEGFKGVPFVPLNFYLKFNSADGDMFELQYLHESCVKTALPGELDMDKGCAEDLCFKMLLNLYAMRSIGVTYTTMEAPAKLNKKRMKHGKPPYVEFKTVHIKPDAGHTIYTHGAGTQQKLHQRRSHIRRYKDGREVRIEAYWAGSLKYGVIHHDYDVETGK